jgi:hypothetical protein
MSDDLEAKVHQIQLAMSWAPGMHEGQGEEELDWILARLETVETELRTALDALARLGQSLGTDLAEAHRRGWEEGQAAIADD